MRREIGAAFWLISRCFPFVFTRSRNSIVAMVCKYTCLIHPPLTSFQLTKPLNIINNLAESLVYFVRIERKEELGRERTKNQPMI